MVDELRRLVAHHRLETEVRIAVEVDDTSTIAWRAVSLRHHRSSALVCKTSVRKGKPDVGLVGDVSQLALPQHGHRAYHYSTRLQHPEPAGGQHRVVRTAKQNTIPGDETEILDQNSRDAVRGLMQMTICPAAAGKMKHSPFTATSLDHAVQQLRRAIHHVGIRELRNSTPVAHGLVLDRGKPVETEAVKVA